jgi:hypothetical protein
VLGTHDPFVAADQAGLRRVQIEERQPQAVQAP